MNAYDFLKYIRLESQILAQANIGEIATDRDKIEKTNQVDNCFSYGIFTGLLLTSTIVLLTLLKKFRSSKTKVIYSKNLQTFVKIPCRKCRFFSNNPYLKCAIRPSSVMNERAIDCPDYYPYDPESATKDFM
jgi:hypothetical protein